MKKEQIKRREEIKGRGEGQEREEGGGSSRSTNATEEVKGQPDRIKPGLISKLKVKEKGIPSSVQTNKQEQKHFAHGAIAQWDTSQ